MMSEEVTIPADARIRYIERRKKDIESLRSALSIGSFEEFKRIGHQLKGNAASFGYADLEKVAIQIEIAGENQDAGLAQVQLSQFEKWLDQVSGKVS